MFKGLGKRSLTLQSKACLSKRLFSSSRLWMAEARTEAEQPKQSWAASVNQSRPRQPVGSAIQASINNMQRTQEASKREAEKNAIDNSFVKKFQPGSTYDPFDFSLARLRLDKINQQSIVKKDRFRKVKLDPLALWTDASALSSFISTNGRILPNYLIGTKGKTQKRLAKAIRRCRAAGLLSTVHKSVDSLTIDPPARHFR